MIQVTGNLMYAVNRVNDLVNSYKNENSFIREMCVVMKETSFYNPEEHNKKLRDALLDYMNLKLNIHDKVSPKSVYNINMAMRNINNQKDLELISEAYSKSEFKLNKEDEKLINGGVAIDYAETYKNSDRELRVRKGHNDYKGVKYELAKQWYIMYLINNKIIYNRNKIFAKFITTRKKKEAMEIRSKILSNYNDTIEWIAKEDKNFNFTDYIKTTPFYREIYKVDKRSIGTDLPI